jgi:hypothetical protein
MAFSDIITAVSKRLIDPLNTAVDVSDVKSAINEAVGYWKIRRFWFNEVSDTATLTAQDPNFPFPTASCLLPAFGSDGFYIIYSNLRYPLLKVTNQQFDQAYLSNGYGIPRWYARIGDVGYQCYPIPDKDYTLGRHYLKEYPELVDDGDTNDFTDNASRLLMLRALETLTMELRQDATMAAYYRDQGQAEYQNMLLRTTKQNASGSLSIASML